MNKVLIVEDDPMVALINRRYLETIGNMMIYGPVCREEDVVEILKKEEIDLILLDVYLPQKSGLDILKSIRINKYYGNVIMITAANSKEEVKCAYAYGVVDYLVKPFDLHRFQKAIEVHQKAQAWLNKKDVLEQKDIDKEPLIQKDGDLPKGLNRLTLEKIMQQLRSNGQREWTLRELAKEVEISNVTIKKYMDYLGEIGQVTPKLTSGQIGRPEYRYFLNY